MREISFLPFIPLVFSLLLFLVAHYSGVQSPSAIAERERMGLVLGVADHFRAELAKALKRMWSRRLSGISGNSVNASGDDDVFVALFSAIETIKPGSHVYSYRRQGLYSHHGIYEGNGYVIHFTRTEEPEGIQAIAQSSSSGAQDNSTNHSSCPKGCYMSSINQGDVELQAGTANPFPFPRGVIRTCLECFLRDGSRLGQLCLYSYGVPWWRRWLRIPGSCTGTEATSSQSQVIETAQELLRSAEGFEKYKLLSNNCEHFATFCCTGMRISEQTAAWAWLSSKLYTLKAAFLPSKGVMPSALAVDCEI